MPRPKTVNGKKYLKIRVSEKFYNFLKRVSEETGFSISETCRSALEIFFMAYFTGRLKGIEDEFWRKFGNRGVKKKG